MTKLTEVQSIHEQREVPGETIKLEKGVWIEVSDLNHTTEEVIIYKRWEVVDIKKEEKDNKEIYVITCKKRDFVQDELRKTELSQKIIAKHNDKLKASFVKCLIDGINNKSTKQLKSILYKLGGGIKDDRIKENNQ